MTDRWNREEILSLISQTRLDTKRLLSSKEVGSKIIHQLVSTDFSTSIINFPLRLHHAILLIYLLTSALSASCYINISLKKKKCTFKQIILKKSTRYKTNEIQDRKGNCDTKLQSFSLINDI